VEGEITNLCPASILRTHSDCVMFLDRPAASRLARAAR
jgi:glucosamine-6-phosphate deaminase